MTREAMLDSVLSNENPDFRKWAEALPPKYWARYDLSACRIGWEACREFYQFQGRLDNCETNPL